MNSDRSAALWDEPFLRPADVQQAYYAQNTLHGHKHGRADTASIYVNRP